MDTTGILTGFGACLKVFLEKGLVTDEEITAALADVRKKAIEDIRFQSKKARTDASIGGHARHELSGAENPDSGGGGESGENCDRGTKQDEIRGEDESSSETPDSGNLE